MAQNKSNLLVHSNDKASFLGFIIWAILIIDVHFAVSVSAEGFTLVNPIKSNNLVEFLGDIVDLLIKIGIPIAAFFIIYAGFKFVVSRGNVEKVQSAKKTLLWAVVGSAVLMGAWVILSVITTTVAEL